MNISEATTFKKIRSQYPIKRILGTQTKPTMRVITAKFQSKCAETGEIISKGHICGHEGKKVYSINSDAYISAMTAKKRRREYHDHDDNFNSHDLIRSIIH